MTGQPDGPDTTVDAREVFGLDTDLAVPAFSRPGPQTPEADPTYRFDPLATLAIVSGFSHRRRVLVQGPHGTGKSSHVEQVAARLNWPCLRVNLDGHLSRMDLIGKDVVRLDQGRQVTGFAEGIIPSAMRRPTALVLDEYDAARPEVLFVLQRMLEPDGRLTLFDGTTVVTPHPGFRLFATANTVGLGDVSGLYHGVHKLNQAQLDRWNVVVTLDHLRPDVEEDLVRAKVPGMAGSEDVAAMVALANLTRAGFRTGDLSTLMSPRTVFTWAANVEIFGSVDLAFQVTFQNRSDKSERELLAEYFQRCFGRELRVGGSAA